MKNTQIQAIRLYTIAETLLGEGLIQQETARMLVEIADSIKTERDTSQPLKLNDGFS